MQRLLLLGWALACLACAQAGPGQPPTPPGTAAPETDELLKAVLAYVVQQPRENLHPDRTPVIVRRDSPLITTRILPTDARATFQLLTPEEIAALAERRDTEGSRYVLSLRIQSQTAAQAVVDVHLGPALRAGELALCCWTETAQFLRTGAAWTFDRQLRFGVH